MFPEKAIVLARGSVIRGKLMRSTTIGFSRVRGRSLFGLNRQEKEFLVLLEPVSATFKQSHERFLVQR